MYGRGDCHLCGDMIEALERLREALGFEFEVRDVDADPRLAARYGPHVPVLVDAQGEEICHYRLDERALRRRVALK